jgi:isopentenyl diphosphate isomerase/L-lactate dehydrogenase-like FMN-dependent dehydrogenase
MAKRRLPSFFYDAVKAGAPLTNRANLRAFDEVGFRLRAAVVCEDRDLRTTVLDNELSLPVMLACPGMARLLRPTQGEKAVAAAAGRAGTIDIVSMSTGHPLEEVAAAATGPLWQQIYLSRGREGAEEVIERAKAAGYQALTLTIDMPVTPTPVIPGAKPPSASLNWENFSRYAGQALWRPGWLMSFLIDQFNERNIPDIERVSVTPYGPEARVRSGTLVNKMSATWEDFTWIREQWGGPIVAKGILEPDDARRAVDAGCAAVVVSNHGASGMIDTFPASFRMLPEIAQAVGSQCDVLLDGGVRSGAHEVKALALGAKADLIGRP